MQSVRLKIDVPANHKVELDLPAELPVGPAEVIVFSRPAPRTQLEANDAEAKAQLERWVSLADRLEAENRPFHTLSAEEKKARVEAIHGIGRGLFSSPEERSRLKLEEIELEEAKFARRR